MTIAALDSAVDVRRYRTFTATGDWTDWTEDDIWPTYGAEAVAWIEQWCVFGEGARFGEPAELLYEWRLLLYEWFEYKPGRDGAFIEWRYKRGLWGFPKGCGKTQVLAWLAVLVTFGPWPIAPKSATTRIAAAAFDQAKELFGAVQVCCGGQDNIYPDFPLSGHFHVQDAQVIRVDGAPGRIERIAAAAGTSEGSKVTTFIGDELHEWTGRKENVWHINVNAIAKRPDARALGISTAGVRGSTPPKPNDPMLWKMYYGGRERHRAGARDRFLFRWREASEQWDLEDPVQLAEAIREAAGSAADVLFDVRDRVDRYSDPEYPNLDYARRFLNRWMRLADDSWLADHPTAWAGCADSTVGIPDGADVVIGVDGARKLDCFAVVIVWRAPDGRHVWRSKVWRAPTGGTVKHSDVFDHIVLEAIRYNVLEVVYDPALLQLFAEQLAEDHGLTVTEVPQSPQRRSKIDLHCFKLIVNGDIAHDGDPILEDHVLAGAWKESDSYQVLSKGRSGGKIDALVAGAMASWHLDTHDGTPAETATEPNIW